MNDDLGAARGIAIGTMIGMAIWFVIFGVGAMATRWIGWW